MTALRLSVAGSRLVDDWQAGRPIGPGRAAAGLARTLVDRGVAHPQPGPDDDAPDVAVVIPVRDRERGLARTLRAVAGLPVVVVDDGSLDPEAVRRVGEAVTIVRNGQPLGPAGARDRGWPESNAALIAFVDADVEIGPEALVRLCRHFSDPAVGAVAPRIASSGGGASPSWLSAYEAVRSPLDLGGDPAPVRPGSRVAYVPTTVLIVRRSALEAIGGFDDALTTGEDVDLVWRLAGAGWRVRYEPTVVGRHPTRDGLGDWLGQRVGYGRSAAPLHQRHGEAVAPFAATAPVTAPLVALVAGYRRTAVVLAVAHLGLRTIRSGAVPRASAARLALLGQLHAARVAGDAVRRTWWPLAAALALGRRRTRPALGAAFLVGPLITWIHGRPAVGPARFVGLHIADDIAYGLGVWQGVVRTGDGGALRPVVRRRARTAGPSGDGQPATAAGSPAR